MSVDTNLTCRDCGAMFVFSSGEHDLYASRGFDNPPSRCSACRADGINRNVPGAPTPV